ncbi:MAG: glycosyltransferase family 2 protein [bacterium]
MAHGLDRDGQEGTSALRAAWDRLGPSRTPRLPPPRTAIESEIPATPRYSSSGVTILVPAYNEESAVEGVVERLCGLELGVPLTVLVVNDGSTDGTGAKLKELSGRFEALKVIDHPRNMGYGAALKTGFGRAATDVVVITDADGTYPEDRIIDLLACIDGGADMAIGARTGADVHIPLIRRPAKAALRHLASFLAGATIPDLNSGLRAFRRAFVMQYRPILPDGFSFTTTITLAAMTTGHPVDYITINYAHRAGSSKIRPIRDTLGFTALIIRTVLYFNPLKVFYPLALLLLGMLLGFLSYDLFWLDEPNLGDKTVFMFVAFVQVLSVGLLADLIEKKSRL